MSAAIRRALAAAARRRVQGDPYFANVVLLMHAEGNSFVDATGRHTFTTGGVAPTLSATRARAGSKSALFSANGNLTTAGSPTDWDASTGGYTIEFSYWPLAGSFVTIMSARDDATSGFGWHALHDNGTFYFQCGTAGTMTVPAAITVGAWNDVAIDIVGSTTQLRVNGVLKGSAAFRPNNSSGLNLAIGRLNTGTPYYLNGHLDEIRITKGVARHNANYTPAFPFPDV